MTFLDRLGTGIAIIVALFLMFPIIVLFGALFFGVVAAIL